MLLGILIGYAIKASLSPHATPHSEASVQTGMTKTETWTCSMHPQIRQPNPGQCPLCGMDLVLVATDEGDMTGPRVFTTSEAAKEIMQVQTSEVRRQFVDREVRLVGKVAFDETRLSYITAWVPGRLDRLYVDYTGIQVKKGDHMVDLYSPELLTAQDEVRRAAKTVREMKPTAPDVLKQTAQATLMAAKEKLRLWGLTDDQIRSAERREKATDHITIFAPTGGTVVQRMAQEGMYVETGTRIYAIADLAQVWVLLDAYESDLPWLHYGQPVAFTTESYPGEAFEGKISFIDPVLDPKTRTVKVRVNVPNDAGRLKPEMFVHAVVHSQVASGNRVMDPQLAGKWISPMHPEIIKDAPGTCDICGMDLVTAEDLGYVPATADENDMPLVIPVSAPLVTGRRAVVYVEVPGTDKPTYEGREVVLGPRAGDFFIVDSGLAEGERVVTNGSFKIDSALQIQAKPSMMTTTDDVVGGAPEAPAAFQAQLIRVYEAYLQLQDALADDYYEQAKRTAGDTATQLAAVDMALLHGKAHVQWMQAAADLRKAVESMQAAEDIDGIRAHLALLSDTLWTAINHVGIPGEIAVFQAHCPMAFQNQGANWLQSERPIRNPYYGASMLTCGSIVAEMNAEPEQPPTPVNNSSHQH